MGFMDEYYKVLQEESQKSGSGGAGTTNGSNYMAEYNRAIASAGGFSSNSGSNKGILSTFDAPVSERIASRTTVSNKKKKKKDEEEKERKWFQNGHFEDGWDFGDVTKTILGIDEDTASLKELTVGSAKRGFYNSRLGEESYKAMMGNANEKEAYQKLLESEEYQFTPGNDFASVISGAFEQGGQLLRQITNPRTAAFTGSAVGAAIIAGNAGPQALVSEEIISVPAVATAAFKASSAASNFEIEAGHAYNEMIELGVSEETAKKVALAVGGVNAALELWQFDELVDAYKVANKSSATKSTAKLIFDVIKDSGADVLKETAQEDVQELVTIGGVQYASKKDKGEYAYTAEEVKDRLADTTKSSLLTFGAMNAPGVVRNTASIVSEQHNANKLSTTEKKVADKVYNDRLAEAEKNGKISQKEKTKIYDQVVSEMDKGYLSIDDIESALGGKTYEDYKKVSEWEDAIQKEYDELHKMKRGDMTGEQLDREAELKKHLEEAKTNGNRDYLKSQLGEEVFGLVKGSRLTESYNERTRRGQKFEADLTQYDAKQQGVIQKAIDSGILNNTNRTHEFVDIIAKISADKGVLFDFTNNARLKESGFAIEGKQVNGFVSKDGITLNIDSPKAWQKTVGHEVTHVLEGTELYTELQNTLIEYAKSKGEYDSRYQSLTELYKDVEDANIDNELTADLVGEYLFTDEDFIKNLSVNNRNVFQKIYDEIKYLAKVATGSKEARELEKVKRTFEAAYKEAGKAQSETKYSLMEFAQDGRRYVEIDQDQDRFDGHPFEEYPRIAKDIINEKFNGKVIGIDNQMFVNGAGRDEFSNPSKRIPDDVYEAKMRTSGELDNLLDAGTNYRNAADGADGHIHKDVVGGFDYFDTLFKIGDRYYEAVINIKNVQKGKLFKDVTKIKDVTQDIMSSYGDNPKSQFLRTSSKDILTNEGKKVNGQYSLSDSVGRELSPATAKRFGKSKVVDENGNLKVVYHGTATGEFSIFDKSKGSVEGDFGSGFYFTDNEADVSEHYEGGGPYFDNKVGRRADEIWGEEPDIEYEEAEERARSELFKGSHKFEVYLNIENPAIVGKTILFDGESYLEQYNEEDYDDYDDYMADVEQALADDIENIVWEVEKNVDLYSVDGLADVLYDAYYNGGIEIEELKAKINDLYFEDSNGNLAGNEVTRQIIESLGYDGIIDPTVSGKWNMDIEDGTTHYIVFKPNQIKAVTNQNPTDNPDIHRSLSNIGEASGKTGQFATPANELRYEAPTTEENTVVAKNETTTPTVSETETVVTAAEMQELFPDDLAPVQGELERLDAHRKQLHGALEVAIEHGSAEEVGKLAAEYEEVITKIKALESEETDRAGSLSDADAPPAMDAPFYGESDNETVENPFDKRDWYTVGNQKVKAYMYENPEVKPFFQEEAMNLLGELNDTQKGERWYNDDLHYASGGEKGWGGQKRFTSDSIATLLDGWGMSYADIEKGLNAIIEDNGAENIAAAKKIEFMLNDRLLNGYKDFYTNGRIEPNQDYINLLSEKQINSYSKEAFESLMQDADMYAPYEEKPLKKATPDTLDAPVFESKDKNTVKGQTTMFAPEKPKTSGRVANVLTEEAKVDKKKPGIGSKIMAALVDKGWAVEKLSHETGNHELQAKYQAALPSTTEAKAQYFMENGADGVMSLKDIMKEVNRTGKTEDFFNYLYHRHNVDRMSLEARFGVPNKAVFGDSVTSEVSQRKAQRLESANPEFKDMAEDIYGYNKHLRKLLVDSNVISQETADLWEKMYPHYVPIRRVDDIGANINVALDTNKTGVNAPVKRATGGSSDIQPLFETMAMRTEQTYRAIARNSFGLELKNTLGSVIESDSTMPSGVDEMIDTIEKQDDLLKPGTMKSNPTFTVFENGERVEFEITEDLFDALKPAGGLLGYRNKALTGVSEVRRNLLTTWNPVFALYRNPIKDIQDVGVNSQHPVKTYANVPNAIYQIATGGKWATEYHQNGGKSNTYFDSQNSKFKAEDNVFKKTIGMPLKALETAGEFIEEIPRLAEYIASRKEGRSVERSMLDAARVTTNFAAGGDFTKLLNSHGFTFLNASVQGASQHVRNFREAKQQGLKGYVKFLAKYTVAGLPSILLNNMLWEDDEEYEELNDYVKQNYYVVAKTQDGKFVRIPKGRTAAVIGELMGQMENLVTGDDEVDFSTFYELFMNNIAPNNPIENNILSPIGQAMSNKAWYGDDLVPSRLQKLPAEEQFDESTDSISRWLGEKTGISPYKINYLIDQYSGGVGDVVLPMLTPEAESGDNSFVGNILAPWKKEMTTDSVLNNRNPGDFYDLRDELEVKSNAKEATEEDEMRIMYMDSVSWEMSDLYAKKREIQSSDLPDDEKYESVREIQEEINTLANNALQHYNHVDISGLYAEAGDKRYNKDAESGKWYEIKPKNADGSDNWYYQKEKEVTKGLGITPEQYWNNREEYNFAYDKPDKYAFSQAVGGYQSYQRYTSELYDIKADKDKNGKSINGTRKTKVIDYINDLDADYGEKIILFKSEYNADDTYNQDIIDYLNGRDDISYKEMETILKYLGFNVDPEGYITWD